MSAVLKTAVGAILALGAATAIAQTETDAAPGETRYVIEQLVVTVSSEPEGAGERVDQIKSGDRVEVLERQDEHSHVRLSSGREGWVRSSYLSSAPPMREQLKARTEELEKLRAEKSKVEAELANARKAAAASAAAASAATATPPPAAGSAPAPASNDLASTSPSGDSAVFAASSDSGPPSNPPMFASDGGMPSRPSWIAAITLTVLALAAGFALGWRVLDKRIRAKYGGLRIY
jgi:SH3-like domain-containing protein